MDYRRKRIIILSVILGVLAVIFVFGNIFSRTRAYAGRYEAPLVPNFVPKEVYSYVLFGGDKQIKMIRDVEKGWFIRKGNELFPADEKKINNFAEKLQNASTVRLVTEKPEHYAELGLEEGNKGIELYDADGELVHAILIGTPGGSPQGSEEYVKLGKGNQVYVIKNSLDFYISQDSSYWADLNIFKNFFRAEEISEVQLIARQMKLDTEPGSITLDYSIALLGEESGQRWVLKDNPEIPLLQSETEAIVNSLASLRGGGFVPNEELPGDVFANPTALITIGTNDKRKYELIVGNKHEENSYYVRVDSSPYIYSVKNWALEKILKEKKDLFARERAGEGASAE